MHKFLFYDKFIPLHVSSTVVSHHQEVNFYYTAFGTVTLCRWPSGTQLQQCFSTAGSRPGTGPWHQLHTGPREIVLELITNLNVILYLSTCHTVHISVLIINY